MPGRQDSRPTCHGSRNDAERIGAAALPAGVTGPPRDGPAPALALVPTRPTRQVTAREAGAPNRPSRRGGPLVGGPTVSPHPPNQVRQYQPQTDARPATGPPASQRNQWVRPRHRWQPDWQPPEPVASVIVRSRSTPRLRRSSVATVLGTGAGARVASPARRGTDGRRRQLARQPTAENHRAEEPPATAAEQVLMAA